MRDKIGDAIDARLQAAFQSIGGRPEAVRKLGLGLAGLVSGAMHDAENEHGLHVISDVHPDPWEAFGDGRLDQSATHRARVAEAVAVSLADLRAAYDIGLEEHQSLYNLPEPSWLPATVYFDFGRSDLPPSSAGSLELVAHYLRYHPSTVVTLSGHADPVGKDADNEMLAAARSVMAKEALIAHGVDGRRISVTSHGETMLVTRDPKRYQLNRRVDIAFATDAALAATEASTEDVGAAKAQDRVQGSIGPPYAAERHFPRAAPGLNAPLPSWRWGSISGQLRTEMNTWARHYISEYKPKVASAPALDPIEVEGFRVEPRPIVSAILDRAESDAVAFLERALGRSAD